MCALVCQRTALSCVFARVCVPANTVAAGAAQREYEGLTHTVNTRRGQPRSEFTIGIYDNGPGRRSSVCCVRSWVGEDARSLSETWWLKYAHHFLSLSTEQRTTEHVRALKEELRASNSDFGGYPLTRCS